MLFGFTAMEAVGVGGGGGGGGGGGVTFFLQAPIIMTAPNITVIANHFVRLCFTYILPNELKKDGV
jgi:hypothetical protein